MKTIALFCLVLFASIAQAGPFGPGPTPMIPGPLRRIVEEIFWSGFRQGFPLGLIAGVGSALAYWHFVVKKQG